MICVGLGRGFCLISRRRVALTSTAVCGSAMVKSESKRKSHHKIIHEELPIRLRGSKTDEELFESVGYALSSWEVMDEQLGLLFSMLVGTGGPGAASQAYGQISGFSNRISMIQAAAKAALYKKHDLRNEVLSFLRTVSHLAGKRNNIAHGIVSRYYKHDSSGTKVYGYFLAPPRYNSRKGFNTERLIHTMQNSHIPLHQLSSYCYTAKQVRQIAAVFHSYAKQAQKLMLRVMNELHPNAPK